MVSHSDKDTKTNQAWDLVFEEIGDRSTWKDPDYYILDASTIKHYREPRLMTKHDTSSGVPDPLKRQKLNVLSISRKQYYVGSFDVFEKFPSMEDVVPKCVSLPEYETLSVANITSESNAINAFSLSGILDDFLKDGPYAQTFNGRMASGDFQFSIDGFGSHPFLINVDSAQIEIDAGYESDSSVVIIEAKNVIHDDFNIRQLYYPYRRYLSLVHKPIRLVFLQYTNHTYYLYEYRFVDPNNFSSIELVNKAIYTFDDVRISKDELWQCCVQTDVLFDDNWKCSNVPFIQADRFDRIISLIEKLATCPDGLTSAELVDFFEMTARQANYYPAAGEYLNLIDRTTKGVVNLSPRGKEIVSMGYKDRQLAFAKAMFEHQIFHEMYEYSYRNNKYPSLEQIQDCMKKLRVCHNSESTIKRRSRSVLSWIKWLNSLTVYE